MSQTVSVGWPTAFASHVESVSAHRCSSLSTHSLCAAVGGVSLSSYVPSALSSALLTFIAFVCAIKCVCTCLLVINGTVFFVVVVPHHFARQKASDPGSK